MSERYSVIIPDEDYYRALVKCQAACPVSTAGGKYSTAISRGDFDEALALATEPNPFTLVCGRVCAHPCEDECRRGSLDKPVAIRALKRAAAQFSTREYFAERLPVEMVAERRSQKVAVIGGGPAGLTAARDLALLGYAVTIFEASPVLGGMMHLGIQEYRLPRDIIAKEAQAIIDIGVEVRLSTSIGPNLTLEDLKSQGYQAIFLAIGAHKSRELSIEGANLDGVLRGVEFLLNITLGYQVELGSRVVVIGGGNVAIDVARTAGRFVALDVARTAGRLGDKQVSLMCLESREEMPAHDYEVEEALQEKIAIQNSLGPRRIIGEKGKVTGLETIECSSVFDSSGRFSPTFVDGSEAIVECDSIVLAVGQTSDLSFLSPADGIETTPMGTIKVDPETLATEVPGIYAGGDVAFGPRLLIDAIADGQRVARSIHYYLTATEPTSPRLEMRSATTREKFDDYDRLERQPIPTLPVERRIGFTEVETGYDREAAITEGSRCLKCYISPVFDSEKCVLCGGCADVCPHGCLKLVSLDRLKGDETLARLMETRYGFTKSRPPSDYTLGGAIVKDEDLCIRCGLCAERCPTGAITMEQIDVI